MPRRLDLTKLLSGPVVPAARALLGCRLTAGPVTVRLTEVEAYAGSGGDEASHAHRGRTPRNAVMFGPAGYAYAYFTYGMHWCLNIVCGEDGEAAGVLFRAGEVTEGADLARERRGAVADRDLARGPARLMVALGVGAEVNGTSLLDGTGPVTLRPALTRVPPASVVAGPRVGVSLARDTPWRFSIAGDPTVSVYRPHTPRRRTTPASGLTM